MAILGPCPSSMTCSVLNFSVYFQQLLQYVGGENVVSSEYERVEPDIIGEILPQPLMVPQVVGVLGYPQLVGVVLRLELEEPDAGQGGNEQGDADKGQWILANLAPIPVGSDSSNFWIRYGNNGALWCECIRNFVVVV